MFADDLVVHFKDKIINNIQIHLQNTINDIQYWLNKTGIQLTTELFLTCHPAMITYSSQFKLISYV